MRDSFVFQQNGTGSGDTDLTNEIRRTLCGCEGDPISPSEEDGSGGAHTAFMVEGTAYRHGDGRGFGWADDYALALGGL